MALYVYIFCNKDKQRRSSSVSELYSLPLIYFRRVSCMYGQFPSATYVHSVMNMTIGLVPKTRRYLAGCRVLGRRKYFCCTCSSCRSSRFSFVSVTWPIRYPKFRQKNFVDGEKRKFSRKTAVRPLHYCRFTQKKSDNYYVQINPSHSFLINSTKTVKLLSFEKSLKEVYRLVLSTKNCYSSDSIIKNLISKRVKLVDHLVPKRAIQETRKYRWNQMSFFYRTWLTVRPLKLDREW